MSEAPDSEMNAAPASTAPSPGAMLRAAREARGMHIEALALALKVPISRVQALEADDFDALPDAVFARALAASVCRAIKLDAAPVLALMPAGAAPRLEPQASEVRAVFRDGSQPSRMGPLLGAARRPGVWAVAVLLAGAAALVFFPGLAPDLQALWNTAQLQPVAAQQPAPDQSKPPAPKSTSKPAPSGAEPPALLPQAAAHAVAPAAVLASAPQSAAQMAPATAVASEPVVAASAAEPAAADAVLVLRASSPSWIQVRGATGSVVLERILPAGETAAVPGKPPYAVVIGKADATQVFVRGQRFELAPVTRENVARFEVKP